MQKEENRFQRLWQSFNNNETTEEETQEFLALLQQKEASEVDLLMDKMPQQPSSRATKEKLPSWEEVDQRITYTEADNRKNITKKRWLWTAGSAAACVLVTAAIYTVTPASGNTTLTAHNQDTYFTLSDGSTVILQKGTSLSYPATFNHHNRTIQLSGKAFFNVASNAQKPFIVQSGQVTTTVLGTSFTVEAPVNHKEVTVTVATGKVKVVNNNAPAQVLEAGQALLANTATSKNTAYASNSQQSTAWLNHDLAFENVSLAAVTQTLEKRFNIHFHITTPGLAQLSVNSHLPGNASLTQILDVLSIATGTSYQVQGQEVFLEKK